MSKRNNYNDIGENEIRIIGHPTAKKQGGVKRLWLFVGLIIAVVTVAVVALMFALREESIEEQVMYVDEGNVVVPVEAMEQPVETPRERMSRIAESEVSGSFTEIRDTTINDVPLKIYIPHNAEMSLHIGKVARDDKSIVYVAEAAFIRSDNVGIVGAFVLGGEPRAWGLSVRGYCAVIDGEVTVGVADNSPLFEQATERGGYFFRQYPLVDNGEFVENEPKNKSVRRAICQRDDETFMVECLTKESFHDFTQALVDLGIDNAINLPGSESYGWAVDELGECREFGIPNYYTGRRRMPKNTNYIIWRAKND